jgi:hypothetical protein
MHLTPLIITAERERERRADDEEEKEEEISLIAECRE